MEEIKWLKMLEYQQELHQFSRKILRHEEKYSLTISEIEILSWLSIEPDKSTPLDLAHETGMKKEAISRCLRKLSEKEYIKKEQHPEDKRSIILTLTEKGNNELGQNYKVILKNMYDLQKEMGEAFERLFENIQDANRLLDKINRKQVDNK